MTKIAGSGSISQRHGSADPDPHQNVMDPQHWFTYLFTCGVVRHGPGMDSRGKSCPIWSRSHLSSLTAAGCIGGALSFLYSEAEYSVLCLSFHRCWDSVPTVKSSSHWRSSSLPWDPFTDTALLRFRIQIQTGVTWRPRVANIFTNGEKKSIV